MVTVMLTLKIKCSGDTCDHSFMMQDDKTLVLQLYMQNLHLNLPVCSALVVTSTNVMNKSSSSVSVTQ